MKKILVVDDDDFVRTIICAGLRKAKFNIIEARDGVEGVEKALSETPDLILTDIQMPNKNGLEMISEIRAAEKKPVVIAMSGGGSENNVSYFEMAESAGVDHILNKPIKMAELLDTIDGLLVRRNSPGQHQNTS